MFRPRLISEDALKSAVASWKVHLNTTFPGYIVVLHIIAYATTK